MSKGPERTPLADRFWSRVQKGPACWLWTGPKTNGYGVLGRGGRQAGMIGAHRASWQLHYGEIPAGMFVCHRCDIPACVNPEHLFLGTQGDNIRDCAQKGRQRRPLNIGESNGKARLSAVDIGAIRAAVAGGVRSRVLADKYAVTQAHIRRIVRQEQWTDVLREVR